MPYFTCWRSLTVYFNESFKSNTFETALIGNQYKQLLMDWTSFSWPTRPSLSPVTYHQLYRHSSLSWLTIIHLVLGPFMKRSLAVIWLRTKAISYTHLYFWKKQSLLFCQLSSPYVLQIFNSIQLWVWLWKNNLQ